MSIVIRLGKYFIVSAVLISVCGCGTWRGIPSHGGGKRFEEEQRIVTGAIRQAVADMDISELVGKKVSVSITSLAHSGGGQMTLPGFDYLSGTASDTDSIGTTNSNYDREVWSLNARYTTKPSFRPTVFTTDPDMKYLDAAVAMQLRHNGSVLISKGADVTLFILIDVLGTNYSQENNIIFWKDNLTACCEMTYYALDTKTGKLLFAARRTSARSSYVEDSVLTQAGYKIERSIERITPTDFPTATAVEKPAPTPAEVKPQEAVKTQEPEQPKKKVDDELNKKLKRKLRQANSYIDSGNLDAAEQLINEIRSTDPELPGLDNASSRLQQMRNNK